MHEYDLNKCTNGKVVDLIWAHTLNKLAQNSGAKGTIKTTRFVNDILLYTNIFFNRVDIEKGLVDGVYIYIWRYNTCRKWCYFEICTSI